MRNENNGARLQNLFVIKPNNLQFNTVQSHIGTLFTVCNVYITGNDTFIQFAMST